MVGHVWRELGSMLNDFSGHPMATWTLKAGEPAYDGEKGMEMGPAKLL